MRPPMEKWALVAGAANALLEALEGVNSATLPETRDHLLAEARKAVAALDEHVHTAEECETP